MLYSYSCKSLCNINFLYSKFSKIPICLCYTCLSEEYNICKYMKKECHIVHGKVHKPGRIECFGHLADDPRFLNVATLCSVESSETRFSSHKLYTGVRVCGKCHST